MANDPGVGLSDAIKTLRREFADALADGAGQEVAFTIGEINLEFQVAVTSAVDGKAGVRFWVVSADAGGSRSSQTSHKLAVTLHPVRRRPDGTMVDLAVAGHVGARPT